MLATKLRKAFSQFFQIVIAAAVGFSHPGFRPPRLLPTLTGFTASSHAPLPKSHILFDAQGFTVAGERIPNTMPKALSKTGKQLTHYAFGAYKSGLWAISGHSRDSYDSRYFGPVAREDVRFYAKPLLVF
jgi:type IV secretory pathway protease TraF